MRRHFANDPYHIETWFERDRAHVALVNQFNGETVIEWWDGDVQEAVEDGILNPKNWFKSAMVYALQHKLIWGENRPMKKRQQSSSGNQDKNPSKAGKKRISKKIRKLRREGYKASQAAAIAYSMERTKKLGPRGGYKRNPFSYSSKLAVGFVLGLVGYFAYRQLKRTQTVEVIGIENSDLMFAGTRY